MLPGNLFYGGTWALLPSAAVRHLYTVISGLDPIRDEEAYVERITWDLGNGDVYTDDDEENLTDPEACKASRLLAEQRQRHPLSRRDLVVSSGLHRSTVNEALHALLVPLFGHQADARAGCRLPSIALLKRGKVQPGRPTWYAADRRAWDWWWPVR